MQGQENSESSHRGERNEGTASREPQPPRDEQWFQAVKAHVSFPRWGLYETTPPDGDVPALERYLHGLRVSEALYPSLHLLELTLRNRMHEELTLHCQRIYRSDPHYAGQPWFQIPPFLGPSAGRRTDVQHQVNKAFDQIKCKPTDALTVQQVNRVVANLGFSAWTCFLMQSRHESLWNTGVLPRIFRRRPRNLSRPHVESRLNELRRLRNKVFHHEPLAYDATYRFGGPAHPLCIWHGHIVETIGWMSPAMWTLLEQVDRFPHVYDCQRPGCPCGHTPAAP